MKKHTLVIVLSLAGLCLSGCDNKKPTASGNSQGGDSSPTANTGSVLGKTRDMAKETADKIKNQSEAAANAANEAMGSADIEVAAVVFKTPGAWKRTNPSSQMRAAELKVGGGEGEATVWFTHFSGGQGGDTASNLNRWAQQVKGPDGQPAKVTSREFKVGEVSINTMASEGTFSGMMSGPSAGQPIAGQRVLRAIVEFGGEKVFVSMAGPVETVKGAEPAWDAMLSAVKGK